MRISFYRAAVLIPLVWAAAGVSEEGLVVVANSSVAARQVKSEELREIFLGERRTLADGSKISPVFLKNGPAHQAFLKAYVGKSDGAFRAGWMRLVFTGKGTLPRTFESEAGLLEYVAATPGAIGYTGLFTARPNVKVLAVE